MKKSILSLLAVAAMVSCTQNDMDPREISGDPVEIKLTPNVGTVTQTRTSYDVTVPTATDSLAAVVLVSKTANRYEPGAATFLNPDSYRISFKSANTPTGFSDAATGLAKPVYYPANGDVVYMWGLYPFGNVVDTNPAAGEWHMTGGGSTANFTFTGKEDVMVSKEIKSNKGEAASGVDYANTKLEFEHLLTKLVVKAKGDSAAIKGFGLIKEISLVGVSASTATPGNIHNKVTITLTAGTTPVISDQTISYSGRLDSIPFYVYTQAAKGTTPTQLDKAFTNLNATSDPKAFYIPNDTSFVDGREIAYAMVRPVTSVVAGNPAYVLKVVTELGGTYNIPVILKKDASQDFGGDTTGKAFNVILTFKAAEIKSIVAVGAWVPQGDFGYDIQ